MQVPRARGQQALSSSSLLLPLKATDTAGASCPPARAQTLGTLSTKSQSRPLCSSCSSWGHSGTCPFYRGESPSERVKNLPSSHSFGVHSPGNAGLSLWHLTQEMGIIWAPGFPHRLDRW